MKATDPSSWRPIVTALSIWFAHFLVCWAASELVWPGQRAAHVVAAGATVIAWAALVLHLRGLHKQGAGAEIRWKNRLARRATALAALAVLFNALPAVLLVR